MQQMSFRFGACAKLLSASDASYVRANVLCRKHKTKKPVTERAFFGIKTELLQFHLFVVDMLACFGIKFLDKHFFGHDLLVFAGCVKVTGTGCRFQLDFFASAFGCHDALSEGWELNELSLSAGTQICEHRINTVFVDQTQTGI